MKDMNIVKWLMTTKVMKLNKMFKLEFLSGCDDFTVWISHFHRLLNDSIRFQFNTQSKSLNNPLSITFSGHCLRSIVWTLTWLFARNFISYAFAFAVVNFLRNAISFNYWLPIKMCAIIIDEVTGVFSQLGIWN